MQPGSTNGIFCSRQSFGHALSRAERIRSDEARFAACKHKWKVHQGAVSVLDRYQARSKKGTEAPPNEVTRNHSPRHSAAILY